MEPVATGLVHDDLAALPDDGQRHELIAGEHFVTPAPLRVHQRVVFRLAEQLAPWVRQHGAEAYVAPVDVRFDDGTVLQPDVVVLGPARAGRLDDPRFVDVAPDLVLEVSSPATRSYDLVRKRRVYEEHGVAEFWFVDLDARRVERYVLDAEGSYGAPAIIEAPRPVASAALEGLRVELGDLFDDAV